MALSAAGSWFFQESRINAMKLVDEKALVTANAKADAATKRGQEEANTVETNLVVQLAKQRDDYETKLATSRAALRKLPSCPVPVDALYGLYSAPSHLKLPSTTSSTPVDNPSGTVEAGAVIASCEENREIFDRNATKLNACIAFYNQVQGSLKAK